MSGGAPGSRLARRLRVALVWVGALGVLLGGLAYWRHVHGRTANGGSLSPVLFLAWAGWGLCVFLPLGGRPRRDLRWLGAAFWLAWVALLGGNCVVGHDSGPLVIGTLALMGAAVAAWAVWWGAVGRHRAGRQERPAP